MLSLGAVRIVSWENDAFARVTATILVIFARKQQNLYAKSRAWSVSPQGLMCSLLSANQGDSLYRMRGEYGGVWDACSECARNLLRICPEFARKSEFAQNSLGHARNSPNLCYRFVGPIPVDCAIFAIFVKHALLWQGTRAPFSRNTAFLDQKVQKEETPNSFEFSARFLLKNAPNFRRIFRGFFVLFFVLGNGNHRKFPPNPLKFSMPNPQAKAKKKITKVFWRTGKVSFLAMSIYVATTRKISANGGPALAGSGTPPPPTTRLLYSMATHVVHLTWVERSIHIFLYSRGEKRSHTLSCSHEGSSFQGRNVHRATSLGLIVHIQGFEEMLYLPPVWTALLDASKSLPKISFSGGGGLSSLPLRLVRYPPSSKYLPT